MNLRLNLFGVVLNDPVSYSNREILSKKKKQKKNLPSVTKFRIGAFSKYLNTTPRMYYIHNIHSVHLTTKLLG